MNRYLIFAGRPYESLGGWYDFQDSYQIESLAKQKAEEMVSEETPWDWSHVVDIEKGTIIAAYDGKKTGDNWQRWHELQLANSD